MLIEAAAAHKQMGKDSGSPTHTACRSASAFPIARLETEALSPALPYGSAGETPPTRPCADAQGRVGGGRAIEARRTSGTHRRNTPRRCGRRSEEPFRSAAEPSRRHRRQKCSRRTRPTPDARRSNGRRRPTYPAPSRDAGPKHRRVRTARRARSGIRPACQAPCRSSARRPARTGYAAFPSAGRRKRR